MVKKYSQNNFLCTAYALQDKSQFSRRMILSYFLNRCLINWIVSTAPLLVLISEYHNCKVNINSCFISEALYYWIARTNFFIPLWGRMDILCSEIPTNGSLRYVWLYGEKDVLLVQIWCTRPHLILIQVINKSQHLNVIQTAFITGSTTDFTCNGCIVYISFFFCTNISVHCHHLMTRMKIK